jgi:hypothetical protein
VPTDEEGRAFLLCSECLRPVVVDPVAEDGHTCSCEEPPAGYRIGSREEVLARFSEFRAERDDD